MDPEHTKTVHMDMLHRYWVHWTTLGALGGPRGVYGGPDGPLGVSSLAHWKKMTQVLKNGLKGMEAN